MNKQGPAGIRNFGAQEPRALRQWLSPLPDEEPYDEKEKMMMMMMVMKRRRTSTG